MTKMPSGFDSSSSCYYFSFLCCCYRYLEPLQGSFSSYLVHNLIVFRYYVNTKKLHPLS
uniref:Uncharacterized protein n=1 Tax=Lepeophtheirus salmonis TaxID=72036 RepID=A0A0K2TET4_LEPSM